MTLNQPRLASRRRLDLDRLPQAHRQLPNDHRDIENRPNDLGDHDFLWNSTSGLQRKLFADQVDANVPAVDQLYCSNSIDVDLGSHDGLYQAGRGHNPSCAHRSNPPKRTVDVSCRALVGDYTLRLSAGKETNSRQVPAFEGFYSPAVHTVRSVGALFPCQATYRSRSRAIAKSNDKKVSGLTKLSARRNSVGWPNSCGLSKRLHSLRRLLDETNEQRRGGSQENLSRRSASSSPQWKSFSNDLSRSAS